MHDNFVLIEGGIGSFIDDVVDNGLIISAGVQQSKAIEGSSVGIVIDSIPSIVLRKELRKVLPFMGILEDESQRSD